MLMYLAKMGLVFSIYNFLNHYKTGRKSVDEQITFVLTIKYFAIWFKDSLSQRYLIWLPKRKVANMILEIFQQNQILFKYSFNSKAAKRSFCYYANMISTFF